MTTAALCATLTIVAGCGGNANSVATLPQATPSDASRPTAAPGAPGGTSVARACAEWQHGWKKISSHVSSRGAGELGNELAYVYQVDSDPPTLELRAWSPQSGQTRTVRSLPDAAAYAQLIQVGGGMLLAPNQPQHGPGPLQYLSFVGSKDGRAQQYPLVLGSGAGRLLCAAGDEVRAITRAAPERLINFRPATMRAGSGFAKLKGAAICPDKGGTCAVTQIIAADGSTAAAWFSFTLAADPATGKTGIAIIDAAAGTTRHLALQNWKQGEEQDKLILGLVKQGDGFVYATSTHLHLVDEAGGKLAQVALLHGSIQSITKYAGGVIAAELHGDAPGTRLVHYAIATPKDGNASIAAGQPLLETSENAGMVSEAKAVQGRLVMRTQLSQLTPTPFTTALAAEALGELWIGPPEADWAANRGERCLAPYAQAAEY